MTTKQYGGHSMIAPLKRVIMRRPDAAFGNADPAKWHYTSQPVLAQAQAEHDALAQTVRASGAEVVYHEASLPDHADSIFVFDPTWITNEGAIVLSMGKILRRGEEDALAKTYERMGVPILGRLTGTARAEGGDMMWLDEHTLVVGVGFRTNAEAIRQLRDLLKPQGVSVLAYDLPYFTGPEACLHLLSLISVVDEKMAVIYPSLMPVAFWQLLMERGFNLIEAPEEEFVKTMATNVLAVAPGHCIMLEGNPITQSRLAHAGCEVATYRGAQISLKAEGGATCLTRPVWRS
ncbi:MAG TPA: arginine deiminase family protein [Thermoflexales bacterium]|nr:arginine deiminase family protein [Thermoflexales bacterium]